MSKRKTTEQFIAEAKLVHGNKYDYSKVEYTGRHNKITIICPIHGKFEQSPKHHLSSNYGCPYCGRINTAIVQGMSFKDYVIKVNAVHDNKYKYIESSYINCSEKITIICPIHGEFEQMARTHLQSGCNSCGYIESSTKLSKTLTLFIKQSDKIHNNKYNYSKVKYKNSNTKVCIICPTHGEFMQTPASHLNNRGCPSCAKNGFDVRKPAYLYYLKITTDTNQVLYKIGITNKTVNERFNLTDLSKIEIVKQKLYDNGQDALDWETRLKRMYKEYQYKGPDILSSGNTELFTEDIIAMWDSN